MVPGTSDGDQRKRTGCILCGLWGQCLPARGQRAGIKVSMISYSCINILCFMELKVCLKKSCILVILHECLLFVERNNIVFIMNKYIQIIDIVRNIFHDSLCNKMNHMMF